MKNPGDGLATQPSPAKSVPAPSTRLQLDFIDGMRALAALYIVLHHALQTSRFMPWWLYPLRYGFEIVVVFIAISGFCLALPQGKTGVWKVNVATFFRKRARRILPPYYAAVAIGFVIILLHAMGNHAQDYNGNRFSASMAWSHLALLQNWIPPQSETLDGPLWSIAVECQIYLFFPLLVFLRSRLNRWITLALWFIAIRILEALLMHYATSGFCFLLFIFAEGMLGADLAFRPEYRRWLVPGALLSAVGLFATFQWHKTIAESCLGLGIAFLMAYLTQVRSSIGNKILGWKPLAWIGTFSYSIYLVHSYIEIAPARWLNLHTNIWAAMTSAEQAAFFVVTFPAILLLSYAFHIVFERPFMGIKRQRAEDRLTPTASADLPVHSRT